MFLGLLDPDPDPVPLVRGMDPDPDPDPDLDPSNIAKIVRKTFLLFCDFFSQNFA